MPCLRCFHKSRRLHKHVQITENSSFGFLSIRWMEVLAWHELCFYGLRLFRNSLFHPWVNKLHTCRIVACGLNFFEYIRMYTWSPSRHLRSDTDDTWTGLSDQDTEYSWHDYLPQAGLPPAFPVFFESWFSVRPRSSVPAWITMVLCWSKSYKLQDMTIHNDHPNNWRLEHFAPQLIWHDCRPLIPSHCPARPFSGYRDRRHAVLHRRGRHAL